MPQISSRIARPIKTFSAALLPSVRTGISRSSFCASTTFCREANYNRASEEKELELIQRELQWLDEPPDA